LWLSTTSAFLYFLLKYLLIFVCSIWDLRF
jgi:hypothetical protein